MPGFGRRDTIRLLFSLAAITVFTGCSWLLGNGAVQQILETDAKITADSWGDYLSVAIPDIASIAGGSGVSARSQAFLANTQHIGDVFRYRLYDASGTVRFDSHPVANDMVADEDDIAAARNAVATGVISLTTGHGNGIDRPSYYAEAYVPLTVDGKAVGAIEVYVDQTEKSAAVSADFLQASLEIAGLTALGFLTVLGAYLLRTKEADETIAYVSKHDDLTQLHNRSAFKSIMDKRIVRAVSEPTEFLVFFIDLDKFKNVNDSRGHAVGDSLLKQVATRLISLAGQSGEVCRLGGDEFAIYHPVEAASGKRDTSLGERIVAELSAPFNLESIDIIVGASVGISSFPSDGATSEALLKAADIALYEAKQSGRGRSVIFDPSMEERVTKRLVLESQIRIAAANGGFSIYYQPLVDRDKLAGFEALLRLWDDAGVPIPPATFVPIAEQMGVIGAIGKRTLEAACATAAQWPDDLKVAVNLSALQFGSGDLLAIVKSALTASGLQSSRLELEITESVLIADTALVLRQLQELKQLGVSIALDDFGTGYSSLSYLWMFPFDRVKVDRSFITRLTQDDVRSREMLSSIMALGKSLDLSITAEGVETVEQSAILQAMKIDTIQGYLYGRPVPEAELAGTILKLRCGFDTSAVEEAKVRQNAVSAA